MQRPVLSPERVSPAADAVAAKFHRKYVDEVADAVAKEPWVIVGMSQNPVCKTARKLLDAEGIQYRYISHGSYLSKWRERLSIKLWAGFPTFPMVFHDGKLVGGASELKVFLRERSGATAKSDDAKAQPAQASV